MYILITYKQITKKKKEIQYTIKSYAFIIYICIDVYIYLPINVSFVFFNIGYDAHVDIPHSFDPLLIKKYP